MSVTEPDYDVLGCTFDVVVANLTPFYLTAAKGNEALAAMTILQLLKAYHPETLPEIALAGRILGFSAAAADDLRLSMRPGLSDTKVLRLRTNAVALERSAEKCRVMLAEMQQRRRAREQQDAVPATQPKPASPKPTPPQSFAMPHPSDSMPGELLAAMRAAAASDTAAIRPPSVPGR